MCRNVQNVQKCAISANPPPCEISASALKPVIEKLQLQKLYLSLDKNNGVLQTSQFPTHATESWNENKCFLHILHISRNICTFCTFCTFQSYQRSQRSQKSCLVFPDPRKLKPLDTSTRIHTPAIPATFGETQK